MTYVSYVGVNKELMKLRECTRQRTRTGIRLCTGYKVPFKAVSFCLLQSKAVLYPARSAGAAPLTRGPEASDTAASHGGAPTVRPAVPCAPLKRRKHTLA